MEGFKNVDFIVATTPRSGTRYTATLLREMGVTAFHERCFGFTKIWTEARGLWSVPLEKLPAWVDPAKPMGDSSWLVTPWLPFKPKRLRVLRQFRDPVKTISSIARQQANEPWLKDGQWAPQVCAEYGMPLKEEDAALRAGEFWVAWQTMLGRFLWAEPVECDIFTYKVEDMNPNLIRTVAWFASQEEFTDAQAEEAMQKVSNRENSRGLVHPLARHWSALPHAEQIGEILLRAGVTY